MTGCVCLMEVGVEELRLVYNYVRTLGSVYNVCTSVSTTNIPACRRSYYVLSNEHALFNTLRKTN